MEPDVSKQAKMIEDTISENLRLTFPAKPVTADNTEGVGKLAEEMDKDPGEVLREVNEFAAEHGVPVEDVKVLRDESGKGYEMEVMTDAERKERDAQLSVPKEGLKDNSTDTGETESPSTEEMDDAILNVLEGRLQELEDMGYPMIREDHGAGGSVFYFDSPLTGDRLEFGGRAEAIGVLAQEWAAIESDKFEKMKNSLVGDTAERLNSIPVRGAEFAMETSPNEEMTIDKMSQKSEAHAESLKHRAQIATDQEGKRVSGSSRVLGVSETRYNPERKITIALQKMYMGADPLDCYEEFSEGMVDVWINSGQLTTEEIIYEIKNVEKATGLSVLNLEGVTDPEARRMRAKEAWSKLARGWVVGSIKDERLGAKMLAWFRQMLLTFTEGMNFAKDIIRGAKLKHAKDQGKLDAEVMRMLDKSVGMDWDAQAERIKQDVAQAAKGNKGELTLVLAGKLPSPEAAKANGDPLAGLLADVQDAANSAYGKKHRGDVGEYMAETYVDTNDVMKEINEQHGFEYKSPVQMLTDLSNGLRFGMKQYGTPRLTESVEGDSAKKLPGGLPLYEGYHENEFGQGEISDLDGLKNYLNKKAIAATKGGEFAYDKNSLTRLADEIGTWYKEHGYAEMEIDKIGAVILDKGSVSNSIGHYHRNRKTDNEHKQRVTDAFTLVPDVLQNGKLVEYGRQFDNENLHSYLIVAPVSINGEKCIAAVRVRQHIGQKGRFYLHSVELLDSIKEKSRQNGLFSGSGLDTSAPTRSAQRDVFRIVKKAFSVKSNFSANEAREAGLFNDGVMKAENGTVTDPEISFSIEAKHVSPYSFRKFDTSQVGTGEGRQAFGWGVYFLTNDSVQEYYSSKLGEMGKSEGIARYVVELNAKELDLMRWEYMDHVTMKKLIESPVEEVRWMADREPESGQRAYRDLTESFWDGDDDTRTEAMKQASEALRQSGIKGIQYEDATSRNSMANKTFNYVIFDANDVKITKVNDAETDYEWQNYTDPLASFSVEGAQTDMDFLDGLKDPAKETEVDKGYVDNISREKYAKMTPQAVMIDLITKSSEEKANYLKELKYRFISELSRRGLDKMGRYRDPVAASDQTVRIIDGINIIDIMCQALPGDAKKYLFGVSEERSRIMEAKTNVGRMNAFRRMVLKFEKALDIMLAKQKRESVERLLKYAKPMITKNQITKGKMTAEAQKKINYIEGILSWSDEKWEAEASHIDLLLDWLPTKNDKGEQTAPSDELVAEMTWKKELVDTFGGFRQRNSHGNYIFTAEQVIRAFDSLKSIYTGGREEAAKKRESRGIEIEKRRATLLKGSKNPVVGRYSSDTVLSEFDSKWRTNAKNWGRKLLSFDQYLKNLFGLKNAEARRMEEGKYDATDAFNTEEMKRQEEDMVFFKKVIAESLGNIDEWKKVSDFTVARKFAEWEKTKEFDIYLEKFDVMKDVVTQEILEDALKALEENGKVPEWLNPETEERARATLKQFHEGDLSGDVEFTWLKSAAKDPSKLWISEFEICTLLNHELQDCYADNLDAGGWSQNILRKLEEGLSPEARKINDYFLERYDESWEGVNNVYKEMFNLDMAKITNYSPAALEPKGGNDTPIDMNTRDSASLDKAGAIKTRVTNSAPVKGKSAWQLYNNHFTQMAYWKTHALYLRDVQAIVMHRDVSRFVKSNYGSDAYNGMLSWIECFRCGGINRNEARNGFSKYVNRLSDVMAQGFLSWNPKTMLRQFPAVSASSIDVDIDFWKGVSFALSKNNETDPALKDYLKQRVHFGITPEMKGFENRNKMKPSRVKQFTRAGNEALGKVDKFFTSFSGRVAFGYYQDKAKNSGLGDKEAKEYASKRAVYTMRRTAQPIEAENKSLWENYADGLHKLAFLFKSEPRKNFATAMFAVSLWMNNEISFGKMAGKVSAAALVPGFLNPMMMMNFITAASSMAYYGNMDDPEEVEDVLSYLRSGLMDSVTGIPILGDAVDYAFVRLMNEAFETNMFYNSGTRYLPFQDIANGISSAIDIISSESEDPWKDSVKISRAASMACAMVGVGVDMSGAMTMATRSADQISKVAIGFGETISRLSDSDKALESRIDRLGRVAGRKAKIDARKKKEAMKDAGKAYEISPEAFISSLKEGKLAHGDAVSIVRQKQKESAPDYLKQFLRLSRNDRRKALMGLSEEERKKVIELLKKANIPL